MKKNADGSLKSVGNLPEDNWLRDSVETALFIIAKEEAKLGRPLTDKEVEAIKAQFAE